MQGDVDLTSFGSGVCSTMNAIHLMMITIAFARYTMLGIPRLYGSNGPLSGLEVELWNIRDVKPETARRKTGWSSRIWRWYLLAQDAISGGEFEANERRRI